MGKQHVIIRMFYLLSCDQWIHILHFVVYESIRQIDIISLFLKLQGQTTSKWKEVLRVGGSSNQQLI